MQEIKESMNYVQLAHDYYDSHDAQKFYDIIFDIDHTGVALYPSEEQDDKFIHGSGCAISQGLINKNQKMVDMILKYSDNIQQINVLELGSGRGGLSRFIWKKLNELNRLGIVTCVNIVEKENNYNRKKSEEQEIDHSFEVYTMNFEDLTGLQKSHYDVVVSNECILHCNDISKVFQQIQEVLKPQRHYIFTEYMRTNNPKSLQQIQDFCKSFGLRTINSQDEYISNAQKSQLVLIEKYFDPNALRRHHARIRYDALNSKKDQLLQNVSQQFYEKLISRQELWINSVLDENITWGQLTFKKQS